MSDLRERSAARCFAFLEVGSHPLGSFVQPLGDEFEFVDLCGLGFWPALSVALSGFLNLGIGFRQESFDSSEAGDPFRPRLTRLAGEGGIGEGLGVPRRLLSQFPTSGRPFILSLTYRTVEIP